LDARVRNFQGENAQTLNFFLSRGWKPVGCTLTRTSEPVSYYTTIYIRRTKWTSQINSPLQKDIVKKIFIILTIGQIPKGQYILQIR